MEASESEDLIRNTARWAEAGMLKTIRLRAHLHYASIYVKQKILCPITLQLTYILIVLILLVFLSEHIPNCRNNPLLKFYFLININ